MNKFSFYKNGIRSVTPIKDIDMNEFLGMLKGEMNNKQLELVRKETDKDKRNKLKENLAYVTFAGSFYKRANAQLKESSGFACFDYDDIKDLEKLKQELIKDKYTHLLFVSPSANGLKQIVKIPKVEDDEEYKQYWISITKYFNIETNDESPKDISRACYISIDNKPYFNPNSEIYKDKVEKNLLLDLINESEGKTTKKDTSNSGLEYRKCIALLRSGKSREEIYKTMTAYSKWKSSSEQYKTLTFEKAENFVLQEKEKEVVKPKKKFTKKDYENVYNKIIKLLKEFIDMEEEYYPIVSLWIIGTYFHKKFPAYPYLFFNAMKGSGKTRILKLIANLSYNGKLAGSMGEAVMFRKATERTLCIDEFENVGSKEKGDLRLLLNSAYKRGLVVERMKKVKEDYVVEEFEVYCPVAIANIWGMENVLADRCITLILERSTKKEVTKLIENFEENPEFQKIRDELGEMEIEDFSEIYQEWNSYQKSSVTSGINGISVCSVISDNDTSDADTKKKKLYNMINMTDLQGRDLELFFPLYIVSHFVGNKVLTETLEFSKKIVKLRKDLDREENKDVQLIEFIAGYVNTDFISVSVLANEFKAYIGTEDKWLNSTWIGRGLRRLKLVKDHRRTGRTRQVQLKIERAKEKLLMFKDPDEIIEVTKPEDSFKNAKPNSNPEKIKELQEMIKNFKEEKEDPETIKAYEDELEKLNNEKI